MDKIALGQTIGRAVTGIQNSRGCKVTFYRSVMGNNNWMNQSAVANETLVAGIHFEVQLQTSVLVVDAVIPVDRLKDMTDNDIINECLKVG